jgi:hypothetical protein
VITCPGTTTTVAPSSHVVTVTWPERPTVILWWREGDTGGDVILPGRGARDNIAVTAVPGRGGCADPGRLAPPPATGPVTPHAATARTTAPAMTVSKAVGTMRRFLARMHSWTRSSRVRFRGSGACAAVSGTPGRTGHRLPTPLPVTPGAGRLWLEFAPWPPRRAEAAFAAQLIGLASDRSRAARRRLGPGRSTPPGRPSRSWTIPAGPPLRSSAPGRTLRSSRVPGRMPHRAHRRKPLPAAAPSAGRPPMITGGLGRRGAPAMGRLGRQRAEAEFSWASARCRHSVRRYQNLTWREAALVMGIAGIICLWMHRNREHPGGPVGVRAGSHVGQLVDVLDSHVGAAVEELAR